MRTISFYSYKGGVGRSLAVANLGVHLAQFGARVALLDFDLEAPGLHYKLATGDPPIVPNRGLAGLLSDASRGVDLKRKDLDILVEMEDLVFPEASEWTQGSVVLVPAGEPRSSEYWKDLSQIDWSGLFATSRKGLRIMAGIQDLLEARGVDVLLVDSRTGVTASGGVATTLLPDVLVMLMIDSPEHVDGSRSVLQSMFGDGSPAPSTPVLPVLSRLVAPAKGGGDGRRPGTPWLEESVRSEAVARLWERLTVDLAPGVVDKIESPEVLRSDPDIQRSERLHAASSEFYSSSPSGLADDYLRLFARVVPVEIVERQVEGVRRFVRTAIFDDPEEAVRTLEQLAILLPTNPTILQDLAQAHRVRNDGPRSVEIAQRLYSIHGEVYIDNFLTESIMSLLGIRGFEWNAEFLLAYWTASGTPVELGMEALPRLAQALDPGIAADAAALLVQTSAEAGEPVIGRLLSALARGTTAEELVGSLLVRRFLREVFDDAEALNAAVLICRYQSDAELAELLLTGPAEELLTELDFAALLLSAGRTGHFRQVAVGLVRNALAKAGIEGLDDLEPSLEQFLMTDQFLRDELEEEFPEVAEWLQERITTGRRRRRLRR